MRNGNGDGNGGVGECLTCRTCLILPVIDDCLSIGFLDHEFV